MKRKILAGFLTLAAIAATPDMLAPTAFAQTALAPTAPDYARIIAAPDRSDADRKLDTKQRHSRCRRQKSGHP